MEDLFPFVYFEITLPPDASTGIDKIGKNTKKYKIYKIKLN
jgi:hypothetical protein